MSQLESDELLDVVCLHFLGGSTRTWAPVAERLQGLATCRPIDLPGFGSAADIPGYDVGAMASYVSERIGAMRLQRWILVGHSMGGKVALELARRAQDGSPALRGLAGLLLLASSPPSPEPMADEKRAALAAWIDAEPATRAREARSYIRANAAASLDSSVEDGAVADVLRACPEAWRAWLVAGSREDWSDRIGRLSCPAVVVSGAVDEALGPVEQDRWTRPHLAAGYSVVIEGAGHLLPLERPDEVARLILALAGGSGGPERSQPIDLPASYAALIASERVNGRLRSALHQRGAPDDRGYRPQSLDGSGLALLRAIVARILSSGPAREIDIAARIDARLASRKGDGWRFAALPPDAEAYRQALVTLDARASRRGGAPFLILGYPEQDAVLAGLEAGEGASSTDGLDGPAMRLWFEDLRDEVARIYLAHPAALARIGFGGIGAGGDDAATAAGYRLTGIGERESWEPSAAAKSAS